eukprot:7382872-Prymnesium_polylepis.2
MYRGPASAACRRKARQPTLPTHVDAHPHAHPHGLPCPPMAAYARASLLTLAIPRYALCPNYARDRPGPAAYRCAALAARTGGGKAWSTEGCACG